MAVCCLHRADLGFECVQARSRGLYVEDKIDLLMGYLVVNPLAALIGSVFGWQAKEKAKKVSSSPDPALHVVSSTAPPLAMFSLLVTLPSFLQALPNHDYQQWLLLACDCLRCPTGCQQPLLAALNPSTCCGLQYSPLTASDVHYPVADLSRGEGEHDYEAALRAGLEHPNAKVGTLGSLWTCLCCLSANSAARHGLTAPLAVYHILQLHAKYPMPQARLSHGTQLIVMMLHNLFLNADGIVSYHLIGILGACHLLLSAHCSASTCLACPLLPTSC